MPVPGEVGWKLPSWPGTSCFISQRAAWKSSMNNCASISEVWTHCPSPLFSRSNSASTMPLAKRMPEAVLDGRFEVLDDDIGLLGELEEDFLPLRAFQVERQRPLVAMQILEIGA